jgi:hypothetical protein
MKIQAWLNYKNKEEQLSPTQVTLIVLFLILGVVLAWQAGGLIGYCTVRAVEKVVEGTKKQVDEECEECEEAKKNFEEVSDESA